MAKVSHAPTEVFVLGQHPCAYLAAILLRDEPVLEVLHVVPPTDAAQDRLGLVNPTLFTLHAELGKLKKKVALNSVYGVAFVSDKPDTRSEHRTKAPIAGIGSYVELGKGLAGMAKG